PGRPTCLPLARHRQIARGSSSPRVRREPECLLDRPGGFASHEAGQCTARPRPPLYTRAVARRFGTDRFHFAVVENWPRQEIKGVAAAVACDSHGRAYVGVRNIPPGGGVGGILPGEGRVVVLNPDGSLHRDWDFKFSSPHAVWVNDQDEVFVADTGRHTI